jgi:hypothetical protein
MLIFTVSPSLAPTGFRTLAMAFLSLEKLAPQALFSSQSSHIELRWISTLAQAPSVCTTIARL